MTTNIDRATKLLTKLGTTEEKIANLNGERDTIINELNSMFGTNYTTNTPTKKTTTTKDKGSLGERITAFLQKNGPHNMQGIASAMKIAPQPVGLSLHHLTKKNIIFVQDGAYYPTQPLQASAKTATMGTYNAEPDDVD